MKSPTSNQIKARKRNFMIMRIAGMHTELENLRKSSINCFKWDQDIATITNAIDELKSEIQNDTGFQVKFRD